MKREEKNVLSRQRILDAARVEFSHKGYDAASMNAICAENDISKGIIYHYYKDKDELYLLCVKQCFDALTAYLQESATALQGSAEQKMNAYFDARLHFFAQNQSYLGIFADAVFTPPESLREQIAKHRAHFDKFNKSVLTELLKSEVLREGLSAEAIVQDFGMYMDYFNLHFKAELLARQSLDEVLREHEERCHRQLHILFYGVVGVKHD